MVRPVNNMWVRAIVGPLGGERIPRRWRTRTNREGDHDIWVIHHYAGQFRVWRWQISRVGKIRKAAYPTVLASSIAQARAVVPLGLISLECDAEPSLNILEIWY